MPGRKQAWVRPPFFVGYMRDIMPDKQTSLYSRFFIPAERQGLASFPFDDFSSTFGSVLKMLMIIRNKGKASSYAQHTA